MSEFWMSYEMIAQRYGPGYQGYPLFGAVHLGELEAVAVCILLTARWYRRSPERTRRRILWGVTVLLLADEAVLVIAMLVSENVVALMMAALAGGCIGFMPYNLNPAKIFMGDTGSTFLGFVLATVSIQGLFKFYTIISFAVPFLMLGLPLFDTCFAILRRLAKGQSPMAPDRSHVHHRLIDMGFNQKQAVAILYVISAILGLSAVVLTTSGALKAMVLLCALCLAGLISGKIFLSHNENHQEKTKEKESNDHAIESHDDLRDPPGGGEDGPSGKGTGEQS